MMMPGIHLFEELGDDLADHLLEQEAADPGARVHGGEDEDRLEHDGEVVPVGHQPLHEGDRRKRYRPCPRPGKPRRPAGPGAFRRPARPESGVRPAPCRVLRRRPGAALMAK